MCPHFARFYGFVSHYTTFQGGPRGAFSCPNHIDSWLGHHFAACRDGCGTLAGPWSHGVRPTQMHINSIVSTTSMFFICCCGSSIHPALRLLPLCCWQDLPIVVALLGVKERFVCVCVDHHGVRHAVVRCYAMAWSHDETKGEIRQIRAMGFTTQFRS